MKDILLKIMTYEVSIPRRPVYRILALGHALARPVVHLLIATLQAIPRQVTVGATIEIHRAEKINSLYK
jgi:hypothetical protein